MQGTQNIQLPAKFSSLVIHMMIINYEIKIELNSVNLSIMEETFLDRIRLILDQQNHRECHDII